MQTLSLKRLIILICILSDKIIDWVLGYDFFISYAHADGKIYPRSLLAQLKKSGFRVFFDEKEYKVGNNLRALTRRRVRHSKHLIIIGRPSALCQSREGWVTREVDVYQKRHENSARAPIIINVNGALENALKLPRKKAELAHIINDEGWFWMSENLEDSNSAPRNDTLKKLKGSFQGIRQDTKQKRVLTVLVMLFLVITFWAVVAMVYAKQETRKVNLQLAKNFMLQGVEHRDVQNDPFRASNYFAKAVVAAEKAENTWLSTNARIAGANSSHKLPLLWAHFSQKWIKGAVFFGKDEQQVLSWNIGTGLQGWDLNSNTPLHSIKKEKELADTLLLELKSRYSLYEEEDGDESGIAGIKDNLTGKVFRFYPEDWFYGGVEFSSKQDRVLTWEEDGFVRVWVTGTDKSVIMKNRFDVIEAKFSPNEKFVLTWKYDGTAMISDSSTGTPMAEINHPDRVIGAQFSQDSKRILTWSRDGTAWIWDAGTSAKITTMQPKKWNKVKGAQFSVDAERVLTWSEDGTSRTWNSRTGFPKSIGPMKHENSIYNAQFIRDGKMILTRRGKTIQFSDSVTGDTISNAIAHQSIYSPLLNQGQSAVVTNIPNNYLQVWDVSTGEPRSWPMAHEDFVSNTRFSLDQQRLLSMTLNGVRVWDSSTGEIPSLLFTDKTRSGGALFSQDERLVLTWGTLGFDHTNPRTFDKFEGTARVWDAYSGKMLTPPLPHPKGVDGALFSQDQSRILTWSTNDGTARTWDSQTGKLLSSMKHEGAISGASFSQNELRVITWGQVSVHVWDSYSGNPIGSPIQHDYHVKKAQFSQDQKWGVSWGLDGTVRIWDISTGLPNFSPPIKHEHFNVGGAQFSEDQQRVLTWDANGVAMIWDSRTGNGLSKPMKHKNGLIGAMFSKDQKRVLTWGIGMTQVWDSDTGELGAAPMPNSGRGALFSKDQRWVLTWGGDSFGGMARVWSSRTGIPISNPMYHKKMVLGAVFSNNQQRVLTWSKDGTARVWDSKTGRPLSAPMQRAKGGALFSEDEQQVLTWGSMSAQVWDSSSGLPLSAPFLHKEEISGALFSKDLQRVLTWSKSGSARAWDLKNDFDYPKEYLSLRLEIKTRHKVNETGDVSELTTEKWNAQWLKYESIARKHLKQCKYPRGNWYLYRMLHRPDSCSKLGDWLEDVNPKKLDEVKGMYAAICVEQGRLLLSGKYYEKAKSRFETALAAQPKWAAAYEGLARTLIEGGEAPAKGIEFAKQSLEIDSHQSPSYALDILTDGYAVTGQNSKAAQHALKLAQSYTQWQEYHQALNSYNKAKHLQGNLQNSIVLDNYQKALDPIIAQLKWEKNFLALVTVYKKALEAEFFDSNLNATWANNVAWILIDKDLDIKLGITYAKRSLQLAPSQKQSLAIDTLALGFIKQKNFDNAILILLDALKKEPDNRVLKYRLKQAKQAMQQQ